ncbi:TPA: glycosyltransferase [Escherichia coli]|nr:glycosyltransferase [Escherichia coli]
MTMPIPLISQDNASRVLAAAYGRYSNALAGTQVYSPCLLLALPPTWNNRFQALLYEQAGLHQYITMGIGDPKILKHVSWPGPIVLHAHWFSSYFNNSQDEVEASARLDDLCEDILVFRARTGAKLLWTAHNIFPHENRFPLVFLRLRQWIFENFDAVHVMQQEHVSVLETEFSRKAPTTFVVPHMLYSGSYPDGVSVKVAKNYYGIQPDEFVFGFFGSIQPYKNLELFLSAFDQLQQKTQRPIAAIVGGVPSDPETVLNLKQHWGMNSKVRLLMRIIPDHEIQYIHRAADVMVFPYGETLNSGAAYMAVGFGHPVIMPDGMASRSLEGLGVVRFDSSMPDGLIRAMADVMNGKRGHYDKDALAQLEPKVVSAKFFSALDQVIGRKG